MSFLATIDGPMSGVGNGGLGRDLVRFAINKKMINLFVSQRSGTKGNVFLPVPLR